MNGDNLIHSDNMEAVNTAKLKTYTDRDVALELALAVKGYLDYLALLNHVNPNRPMTEAEVEHMANLAVTAAVPMHVALDLAVRKGIMPRGGTMTF